MKVIYLLKTEFNLIHKPSFLMMCFIRVQWSNIIRIAIESQPTNEIYTRLWGHHYIYVCVHKYCARLLGDDGCIRGLIVSPVTVQTNKLNMYAYNYTFPCKIPLNISPDSSLLLFPQTMKIAGLIIHC